jgi:hypothetical protein
MYLVEIIQNAKYVISLDADLSDWNIKFLQEIQQNDYIVYYNTIQNKHGIDATFYKYPQILIDKMAYQIKEKQYFISCFDCLTQMNLIIKYLSQFGNKNEWLIYSSEIDYNLIDTKDWINKFVFFTPTIIYGIDYNYEYVDVFSFIYKSHLNPLQIYQMISRARKQNKVHIYCNEKETYNKYKCIEDVIIETKMYEDNLGTLVPLYSNYIDIDDKPYRTMYYNFKYMDSILKTNIKGYLEDMLIEKGYTVLHNEEIKKSELTKSDVETIHKNMKERIINLLHLNKDNLTEFEKTLVSDDKALEKHINLKLFLNNKIDNKLNNSIKNNLLIETIKSKYTKIKICMELMNVLEINDFKDLNKEIISKFKNIINNKWLDDNINTIKKTFEIRTNKYDIFSYYNLYTLLITILKNIFDGNLFIRKQYNTEKNKNRFIYYIINDKILLEHMNIINKINDITNIDFI